MSTTENNSRKRDSTVLDSASTDTSDKRVRVSDDVEEAIIENENRYIAINLTNTNTIEFRIFASTTDYDTFMKTLTFVNNIVMFSKYATKEQIDDLSWEDLFDTNSITNMALSAA